METDELFQWSYQYRDILQKCHGNINLHISKCDQHAHITSSLQVKIARYVWTEEETGYFLQGIKKKITAISHSKQVQSNRSKQGFSLNLSG